MAFASYRKISEFTTIVSNFLKLTIIQDNGIWCLVFHHIFILFTQTCEIQCQPFLAAVRHHNLLEFWNNWNQCLLKCVFCKELNISGSISYQGVYIRNFMRYLSFYRCRILHFTITIGVWRTKYCLSFDPSLQIQLHFKHSKTYSLTYYIFQIQANGRSSIIPWNSFWFILGKML